MLLPLALIESLGSGSIKKTRKGGWRNRPAIIADVCSSVMEDVQTVTTTSDTIYGCLCLFVWLFSSVAQEHN